MHNPYPEQSAAPDERGDVARVVTGEHNDPYAVLGMHDGPTDGAVVVRCLLPGIDSVDVLESSTGVVRGSLAQVDAAGFFAATVSAPQGRFGYRLRITDHNGTRDIDDPYAFPPLLGELDVHLLAEGAHWRAYECLGAHPRSIEGVEGVAFAVWAPNAQRVSVVGPFNAWNGRVHAMRLRIECGVWEIFLPGIRPGASYKFEVLAQDGEIVLKSDPYAFRTEAPPATVACVAPANAFNWNDSTWMAHRGKAQATDAPIAIYEVHLGSWRRHPDGTSYSYDELADELIPYAVEMGFTHLELLPVSEHPFTGSWGYQPISLFAPSARWGEPDGFRRFVDRCHAAGLAVLLDWVPAHFPQDPHGLVRFDGSCLYEYEDTRIGRHHAWGTLVYNFGRREVANFLIVNALFWLREFHVDGLRVDAVASMLYLDYERKPGEWLPNIHGGRENLEAVAFLRRLNVLVHSEAPAGAVTFAEESTTWPMVTGPEHLGGLGFDYKWNMGWMNDTLAYMRLDPIHRRFHHHLLTFGQMYATSENFVLPLSHDEMVHGKGSLIGKMPGDRWRKFANLRLYLAFQYTDPGKKLLFMGGEFAQEREWNHDRDLDWSLLADPAHAGVQRLLRDLNGLYRTLDCLHSHDCDRDGFRWIDCNDVEHSVLAWRRIGGHPRDFAVIVCNFTPVPRHGYRIGVPIPGEYREVLNTDALAYGGSGVDNPNHLSTAPTSWHGEAQSLTLTLPPLAALVLLPPAEAEEMEADVIEADLIEAAPPDVLPRDP